MSFWHPRIYNLLFFIYFLSQLLQFSQIGRSQEVIDAALEQASSVIENLYLTDKAPPRIAYTGPLGRERTLKLDIADDELVLETCRLVLIQRWNDLPTDAYVPGYTLKEIAGEKLRCVMQRLQCRDLFDLSLLFGEAQVDPYDAAQVFIPKAAHRGIDPDKFAEKYLERIDQYRDRWEKELSNHVQGDIPHFDALERGVARGLRSANLL